MGNKWCIVSTVLLMHQFSSTVSRSFVVDYERNTFLKDGKPCVYISGSLHYERVPYFYWADRLQRLVSAGLDAVQTYVTWNVHEPQPGVYDFSGQRNLSYFLQLAQDTGLLVILRAGPYICGNWDYGGLPGWLLSDNTTMTVRTMDHKYITAVNRWFAKLLPYVRPHLYSNGGPVIMAQIENEFGSYRSVKCDRQYMAHLRDIFIQHLGDGAGNGSGVVLFTTDGNAESFLQCGAVDGVYATVDFGPTANVMEAFRAMRAWNPKGPLVNSELYTGWQDYWGGSHAAGSTQALITTLLAIHNINASVNMYMFEGGTTFGYLNGADYFGYYTIAVTSYDYDAPLTEAGDITDKYLAIRNMTSKFKTLPPLPSNSSKSAYGRVAMMMVGTVTDMLHVLSDSPPLVTHNPVNMEQIGQYFGFVLYRHVFRENFYTAPLSAPGIRDRGYVLVNGEPRGVLDRTSSTSFNMFALKGQVLDIIVENQGRVAYGPTMNDNRKGIISNVTLGGKALTVWSLYQLNITKLAELLEHRDFWWKRQNDHDQPQLFYQPAVYTGNFVLPSAAHLADTFANMCGWFKGQLFINGFNVGRYWPTYGPQVTLYVPAGILRAAPRQNHIVILELEKCPTCMLPTSGIQQDAGYPLYNAEKGLDSSRVRNGLKFENGEPSKVKTLNSALMFEHDTHTRDIILNAINFVDKPVISSKCFSI